METTTADPVMREEREFIDAVRRRCEEEVRFFSNAAKPERERWVASTFLSGLGLVFDEADLRSPQQADEVDVEFGDARFQVKELTDPNLRRGAEVLADLRRAREATRVADLVEPCIPVDTVLSNAYLLMLEVATSIPFSPCLKARSDLLFYVTRVRAGLGSRAEAQRLAETGWRSISCLYGSRSIVLAVAQAAPSFLREAHGSQTASRNS